MSAVIEQMLRTYQVENLYDRKNAQKHLRERLLQSGYITPDSSCTLEEIKTMLSDRFDSIDYAQAKQDVEPFVRDSLSLNIWTADFF